MALRTSTLVAACAALASSTVQAADPGWTARGKWIVDHGDDACTAVRVFDRAGATLTFGVRPSIAEPHTELMFGSKADQAIARRDSVQVTLLPSGQTFRFAAGAGSGGIGNLGRVDLYTDDARFLPAFEQSSGLSATFAPGRSVTLSYPVAEGVGKVLKACAHDLIRSYGLTGATIVPIPERRMAAAMISADDYPAGASDFGAQGRVVAAVSFDRAGRETACRVVASKDKLLDESTCRIARTRLRLDPTDGGPTTRWALFSVRWALPSLT